MIRGRCMAPVGDEDALCGCDATEERDIDGIVVLLCPEHAAELDAELADPDA